MRGTKKLLSGLIICMVLAGGVSISQGVQAANDDFIIQDEVLSEDSISDSAIQGEVTDIGNASMVEDESLSQNNVDDSIIPDRATSASDFVIENSVLKKYTGSGGDVVIPDGVTKIDWRAFLDCSNLVSVKIPDGVIEIGWSAFNGCTNLSNIVIPDGVKEIGIWAFSGCTSLTNINIPNSVTKIDDDTFSECTSLTNITIPNSVTEIGSGAFYHCASLVSVSIPNSVTSIGRFAFSGCTNLREIKIPDNVTSIDNSVFLGCSSLKSILVPDGITSIDTFAFSGCNSLYEINVGPRNQFYSSEDGVLYSKDKTTLIYYPEGKTNDNFSIPSGVIEINYSAFSGCNNLINISIPASVKNIYDYYNIFSSCINLNRIDVDIRNISYSSKDGVLYNKDKTILIAYPKKKTNDAFIIPDTVMEIGYSAFDGCANLKNITIPDSVTKIADAAFIKTGIQRISFPASVKEIGWGALYGCPLKEITIFNSNAKLFASEYDDSWNIIGLGEPGAGSAPTDEVSTFNEDLAQSKSSVLTIKGYKGSTAEKLATHINDNKRDYGYETVKFVALDGTSGNTPKPTKPKTPNKGTILKSKNTTYTVTKKGSEVAFTKISSAAASVSIPATVKIGGIDYKVTSISPNAFKGNKKLSKVTIGANITSIGKNAFNGCKNLKSIIIKTTKLKNAGQNAFKGIKSTAMIKVPLKRLKAYKKLLKGKGQGKKVRISK